MLFSWDSAKLALLNLKSIAFEKIAEQYANQLAQYTSPQKVLLAEADTIHFLAVLVAALAQNHYLFLGNTNWRDREWQQALKLIQPDIIFSSCQLPDYEKKATEIPPLPTPAMMIPTGGTSGKIKFAIHTPDTLTASVQGFFNYFGQKPVNSISILPLYHVGGLMPFFRAWLTGGKCLIWSYQDLKQGQFPDLDLSSYYLSLVPTQLQFLLEKYPQQLAQFQTILVGGAPPWPSLLDNARKYNIPVALTYGMTETASQVVTLQPQDFLAGNNSNGRVLPHADLTLIPAENGQQRGEKVGIVKIEAESLFWGYYPEIKRDRTLITDDIGYFDAGGYLHILGRDSQKIITGGENVFPGEVEGEILATELVQDVCVVGLKDDYWGEIVAAIYVPISPQIQLEKIKAQLRDRLAAFKQPKQWVIVTQLPRNAQGKINLTEVKRIAQTDLNLSSR
ncbi:MAG: 2-succinylbenzoate--CoA ligase [Jaaginema sp. PMC 1079.18]|nr:2-succinylbenzoate--CoA ligase [Jaaginema sp. PMC 1080.18]MEC4852049.1 2-succinylbenzoate--CoA ligase [Jaaginema sp. PMC 1079.18]MEC4864645.1 2-succinylbenzoate--CoA ligase [Jaaginema sp. PMC 1078.18]